MVRANTIEVFLVAIPFGKVADSIGRKKVFALSIAGLIAGTTWILVVCMTPWNVCFDIRLIVTIPKVNST